MSKTCSRLRKILKTHKSAATISPISGPKPISIKDIAEEPNLDDLAKTINKLASESKKFRSRHNIYDFTISRFVLNKRFNLVEELVESHKKLEEITNEGFALRLISFYAKAGMFDHARKLFDELPQLGCPVTVRSLNALLKAALKSKRYDEVFRLFKEVPSFSRDVVSYNIVIHARCETGSLDEALLLLDEMKKNEVSPTQVTFNTLLAAFYREKGFEGGRVIWDMMDDYNVVRDTRSYYLKMRALVDEGKIKDALDLFVKIKCEGFKLDANTFNVFVKEYCDQGNVEAAKKWYFEMLESDVKPDSFTFAALVPKFCDGGEFELAFELSKKMFKRQIVVDKALLQLVIDGLVKGSMRDEAEELVELGRTNVYFKYDLEMPPDNTEKPEQDQLTKS